MSGFKDGASKKGSYGTGNNHPNNLNYQCANCGGRLKRLGDGLYGGDGHDNYTCSGVQGRKCVPIQVN